jgi:hypothetical protein
VKTTNRTAPRWLNLFTLIFSAAAATLWLLALISSRSVLFPAGPNFEDILVYKGRFTLYHTAKFFTSRAFSGFAYPAGAAPIYEAFYRISDPVQTYLVLAGITTVIALAATFYALRRNGAARLFPLLLLFSFPLIFLIQRSNIEIILWIIVALGIVAFRKGALAPAAILFGIAASIKLYPVFLLGLFLSRRKDVPAFAVGIFTAIFTTLAAIKYTGPTLTIAARGFFTGVDRFQDHYVDKVSQVEIVFDHSLLAPLKYWCYLHRVSPAPWTHTYYLIAGALALAVFLRVRTLPPLNRIVFLLAAMVCLPPVSFSYTLVHLYAPLLLVLCFLASSRTRPPATAILALAILLFLMFPLASLNTLQPLPTGPFQSVALLALLIVPAMAAWPESTLKAR